MSSPRPGYTLFELMVVLAIIVILAAVAFPTYDAMSGSFRVTEAVDMVRARWAESRAHAMSEGRPYRFSVIPNQGNYRLAPDGPEFWPTGTDDGSALVMESTLPKGVRFRLDEAGQGSNPTLSPSPAGGGDGGAWHPVALFLPDGTAQEDREIVFAATGARPVALKLRALTGAVTVRTLNPNNHNGHK